mgnify:CR=1 FL=1
MNKVCLVGRLTAKPELRYTGSNVAYTRFTVAVNRTFSNSQGQRDADFISVVAWRRQAETITRYFDKGNLISLDGRIQTGSYTDKDGNRRYTTDVALENFEFVESRAAREARNSDVSSNGEPTPYDYEEVSAPSNDVNIDEDPFADFGDNVSIDDNFLD